MVEYMFTRHYSKSKKTYWIHLLDSDEFEYNSIEELVEGFKKILNPDFHGKIPVNSDAPDFLKAAYTQAALGMQYEGTQPTFTYGAIEPENQRRINDLLPDGIEIEFQ